MKVCNFANSHKLLITWTKTPSLEQRNELARTHAVDQFVDNKTICSKFKGKLHLSQRSSADIQKKIYYSGNIWDKKDYLLNER